MSSLYELNEQLQAIDELLTGSVDGLLETQLVDEESRLILEDSKNVLLAQIEGKLEHILEYIGDCKGRIDYLKSEEARLAQKRKSLERRIDFLKGLVMGQMKLNGLKKAEYGTYNVSIAKTPAKVVLTDDADFLLPDNLCTITRTPNKSAIKELIGEGKEYRVQTEDGDDVVLAYLDESGESLRIK